MFPGVNMLDSIFGMIFGAMQILIIAGGYAWLQHYGKSIAWWQMGESFLMKSFQAAVHVFVEGSLAFADNTLIDPARWDYVSLGLWQGFSHNSLLYVYFPTDEEEKAFMHHARQKAAEYIPLFEMGASRAQKGVCVRVLGDNGDKIYTYFREISQESA